MGRECGIKRRGGSCLVEGGCRDVKESGTKLTVTTYDKVQKVISSG